MNSNLACRRLACLVAAFVCIVVGQAAADKPAASPPSPEAHVFGGPSSGSCNTTDAKEKVIPLAGEWRFELDRKDVGIAEGWFDKELSQTIRRATLSCSTARHSRLIGEFKGPRTMVNI